MPQDRNTRWFVRGTRSDGTRWESVARHNTAEEARQEMELRGPEAGAMVLMRETPLPSPDPVAYTLTPTEKTPAWSLTPATVASCIVCRKTLPLACGGFVFCPDCLTGIVDHRDEIRNLLRDGEESD